MFIHRCPALRLFLFLCVFTGGGFALRAQVLPDEPIGTGWEPYLQLSNYLVPFWKADTVYDEITQVIEKEGLAEGTLLFRAKKILSVRSADLKTVYEEGRDWNHKSGKLRIGAQSAIPFFKTSDLVFDKEIPGQSMAGKTKGSFVLFSEKGLFWSKQIAVTYIPEKKDRWQGPRPVFDPAMLPVTLSRLAEGDSVSIAFLGNSIETGYNSSGFQHYAPFLPSWPEMIIYRLRSYYKGVIRYGNPSVPGRMAGWGREEAGRLLAPLHPDLVIIGFGMNDGSAGISPARYTAEIKGLMDSVLLQNPKAEFILIAPMLANPYAIQSNIQASYKPALDSLVKTGVVVADMTGVHQALLKRKNYQDMTGNNVNHPNDYLARWYAQLILGLLLK